MWSRDPLFPLFSHWLGPKHFNSFVTAFMIVNSRASAFSFAPLHLISFPFLLTLRGDQYGLGQYFGPVILAFVPLLVFGTWSKQIARLGLAAKPTGWETGRGSARCHIDSKGNVYTAESTMTVTAGHVSCLCDFWRRFQMTILLAIRREERKLESRSPDFKSNWAV